jgi:cell fate (sporulation/competence/biofilm development) regulator YlbF (YheA/YmcA/DUF963 family)
MLYDELNDIEMTPPAVVNQAVVEFVEALTETDEYIRFEAASQRLNKDQAAQAAMRAFQEKQEALKMMLMLNAISPEDQAELERLRLAFVSAPAVVDYFQAQAELVEISQAAAEILSQATGLNYSAACGASCCG